MEAIKQVCRNVRFKATVIYTTSGILLGMIENSRKNWNQEKYLTDWVQQVLNNAKLKKKWKKQATFFLRKDFSNFKEAIGIIKGVFLILSSFGIAIGAMQFYSRRFLKNIY